jgi:hypothetical protein
VAASVALLLIPAAGCGDGATTSDGRDEALDVYLDAVHWALRQERIERLRRRLNEPSPEPSPSATGSSSELDVSGLAHSLEAEVGVAFGVPGAVPVTAGSLQSGPAWSTIKVPIALAIGENSGGMDGSQQGLVDAAITRSDNEAAAALFDQLGDLDTATARVDDVLAEAGDPGTEVSSVGRDGFSTYGQTDWSLSAQVGFMGALLNGCIADPADRSFVLDRMANVTSDTWGLGSVGVPALWKGGWGPGVDGRYLLRQMGAITVDGRQYAVAYAVIPGDGDYESGQAAATEVARWIAEHVTAASGGRGSC